LCLKKQSCYKIFYEQFEYPFLKTGNASNPLIDSVAIEWTDFEIDLTNANENGGGAKLTGKRFYLRDILFD